MSSKNAEKFLDELKSERSKLDALISSVEMYLNKEETKSFLTSEHPITSPKSLQEYILEYLTEMSAHCSSEQIVNGILKKGVETQSQKFPAMVNTILYQLKKKNKIIAAKRGYWKVP